MENISENTFRFFVRGAKLHFCFVCGSPLNIIEHGYLQCTNENCSFVFSFIESETEMALSANKIQWSLKTNG